MTEAEFVELIEKHDKLAFFSRARNGTHFVQNWRDDRFEIDDISQDWIQMEQVLLGQRPPQLMQHYTRVVGYYANVANFNRSKVAELKDRQKGDYVLPEDNH